MSIMTEYRSIKKELGTEEFNRIETYLEMNSNLLLSDIYYNRNEYKKYEQWKNEYYKEIL